MRERYEPGEFEQKWRDRWKAAALFTTREDPDREKFYCLEFFPYPSGAGLSVGHCRNYIPSDVLSRMKFMQGYNVLHPMGFDAFGLPAENEAIKTQRHPEEMVHEYGDTYRRQMELVGIGYDWSRCFYSSDPEYYRWTQWCFKLLYERGLAYRRMADVNWCPKDKTALANEEVVGGLCERCGTPVERRAIPQWFFKITDYAQRLIDDLDDIDWPEGIKAMQRNWIGRSEGVEFEMDVVFDSASSVEDGGLEVVNLKRAPKIRVFTTRMDTVYGMTFCVLAPEHTLVEHIKGNVDAEHRDAVAAYQTAARALSDVDRQAVTREKTGVFTGAYAVNPVNKKRVPIYVADYVLMGYGTGAIMAVPGHDQRDFEFAVKFGLDVVPVCQPDEAYLRPFQENQDFDYQQALDAYLAKPKDYSPPFESKDARLVNSGSHNGMTPAEAATALGQWVEAEGIGERKVNYKLRDWLISRQRYWGCPIPVVYDKDGDMELVPDGSLPVELPEVDQFEPGDDGSSPLAKVTDFVNTTTADGTLGRRETDTMGGFACSSWYFLRFADPHNNGQAWNLDKANFWMPVDCYVGGAEHAVMHLLYARFWTKVFYDAGLVSVKEPFQRLMNQGQVLGYTPYRQPREG
ncbi:MAG: leucine--tRNA ligase, partial [Armatimonadetes bacterium]|nr:leucine--tRNA ligase [Armatimonadota bacterium]